MDMIELCVAAPDDDAPRLVWADSVGGERGELVVIQCDLARGMLAPAEVAQRRRRERELLARSGAAWSGIAKLATRWNFRRGFIEAAEVDVEILATAADALFVAAPFLTSLSVTGITSLAALKRVLALPALAGLRGIDLVEPRAVEVRPADRSGDEVAGVLAGCGLAHLRAVGIANGSITARGVHALVELARRVRLERVSLRKHSVGADLERLGDGLPDLTALELTGVDLDAAMMARVANRPLVSFGVTATTRQLVALATSPAAATLEHLALLDATLDPAALAALEAFPRLRSLELACRHDRSNATLAALATIAMPMLRELRLGSYASRETVRAIAEAFGARLDVLDVRLTYATDGEDVRPLVAGEVMARERAKVALLHPTAPSGFAGGTRSPTAGDAARPAAFVVGLTHAIANRVWELPTTERIQFGRIEDHTVETIVTIPSNSVARNHAFVTWRDGRHHLEDMSSTNGSYVNDKRISRQALFDGDELMLGSEQLRYFVGPGAEDRARDAVIRLTTTDPLTGLERGRAGALVRLTDAEPSGHLVLGHVMRRLARRLVALARPGETIQIAEPRCFAIHPRAAAERLASSASGQMETLDGEPIRVTLVVDP